MVLLDTHVVLWAAFEPGRLSRKARALLEDRAEPLAFSLATIWELAIKTSLQRPGFAVDVPRLHAGLLDQGFAEVALKPAHLLRVVRLPWLHRDPFDRLLVAQAIEEGATLLTADTVLKGYERFVRLV